MLPRCLVFPDALMPLCPSQNDDSYLFSNSPWKRILLGINIILISDILCNQGLPINNLWYDEIRQNSIKKILQDARMVEKMIQFSKLKGKKILFLVISDFLHDARVLKEAQSAQEAGMKVTVLVPRAPQIMPYAKKNGIKVACVESSIRKSLLYFWRKIKNKSIKPAAANLTDAQMRFWPCVGTILSIWLINRQFVKIARKLKPDIVHANDPVTLPAAYKLKRQLGCKLIYDSHEFYSEILANPHPLWRNAVIWVEKKSFFADGVMSVNDWILRQLNRRYHLGRIPQVVVMNAPRYERRKHHQQKLPIKLVYLGSMAKHRGVEDFEKIVKSLKKRELWTIGKENLILNQVHSLSAVAPADIVKTLSCFDVGVIPFKHSSLNNDHALPNKLFEYMMAGLAIISSDLPEIAKIIKGSKNGFIFHSNDIKKKINRLIKNPKILEQYKKNSLKAAKEYCWENEEKKQLALYQKILEQ